MAGVLGDGRGGIQALESFLEGHSEAVEADLQRYYGVDIGGLYDGSLSDRRAWVLIRGLPPESLTSTALREQMTDEEISSYAGDGYGRWSQAEMLLARLIDEAAFNTYAVLAVNSSNSKSLPLPKPFPRPGVPRPKPTVLDASPEALAYLQAIRDRHRREIDGG
jgi:hypothetical protein